MHCLDRNTCEILPSIVVIHSSFIHTHTQPLPHQPLKPVKATITANASQLQTLAEDRKHHSDAAVRQRLPDLNESVEASQTR